MLYYSCFLNCQAWGTSERCCCYHDHKNERISQFKVQLRKENEGIFVPLKDHCLFSDEITLGSSSAQGTFFTPFIMQILKKGDTIVFCRFTNRQFPLKATRKIISKKMIKNLSAAYCLGQVNFRICGRFAKLGYQTKRDL